MFPIGRNRSHAADRNGKKKLATSIEGAIFSLALSDHNVDSWLDRIVQKKVALKPERESQLGAMIADRPA